MEARLKKSNALYEKRSKHSQYQKLPSCLDGMIEQKPSSINRYEYERWEFIRRHMSLGEKMLDIGGNMGFFTFESIKWGIKHVDYYEGDDALSEFVQLAAELTEQSDKVKVHRKYFDFGRGTDNDVDTIFCLNVIHHMGIDFLTNVSMGKALDLMMLGINRLAKNSRYMVFQIGFNWGGDREKCLFENGTKTEVVNYIGKGTDGFWKIQNVGIAEKDAGGRVIYREADRWNIKRMDEYGEFLNRPLFILKSEVR